MRKKIDYLNLIGKKFGRLKVLEFAYKKGNFVYLKCKCDCGKEKNVQIYNLIKGKSKSCGCLQKEIVSKHKFSRTRFYYNWTSMKQRCSNKKNKKYNYYGSKGIRVCKRWMKFENFKDDMYQSYLEHIKKFKGRNTTIERMNSKGNYELKNCKWATYKEQNNNTSSNHYLTFNNQTMTMAQWAEKVKIPYKILVSRINDSKWSTIKALTTPIKKRKS